MMDWLAQQSWSVVAALAPAAMVFAVVTLATKRTSALAALRRAGNESALNLSLVVINSVVLASLLTLLTDGMKTHLGLFPALGDFWLGLPELPLLVLALLIDEGTVYWRHRAEHSALLWPIHATHHSDETVTWLTLLRKHPLSHFFGNVVDSIPLILLGFPAWAVVGSTLIRTWWGYFIHADLPWTFGPVGKWLMSPAAHRLHHIDDEVLKDKNFGGFFSIYDRLFGTFDDAAQHLGCKTGIAGGSRSLSGELARPFEAWLRRTKRTAASPAA
jgi:sterol desaturase/sphingolipid hydroxylase (fatty acid hydroxylase superfamily)